MFHVSNSILKEMERNLIEIADLYAILEDINSEGYFSESYFQIDLEDDLFSADELDPDEYPFLVILQRNYEGGLLWA